MIIDQLLLIAFSAILAFGFVRCSIRCSKHVVLHEACDMHCGLISKFFAAARHDVHSNALVCFLRLTISDWC